MPVAYFLGAKELSVLPCVFPLFVFWTLFLFLMSPLPQKCCCALTQILTFLVSKTSSTWSCSPLCWLHYLSISTYMMHLLGLYFCRWWCYLCRENSEHYLCEPSAAVRLLAVLHKHIMWSLVTAYYVMPGCSCRLLDLSGVLSFCSSLDKVYV
jgi:hypothetical protein